MLLLLICNKLQIHQHNLFAPAVVSASPRAGSAETECLDDKQSLSEGKSMTPSQTAKPLGDKAKPVDYQVYPDVGLLPGVEILRLEGVRILSSVCVV